MSNSHATGAVHVRQAALRDVEVMAICHTRSIRQAYKSFIHESDLAIFTVAETASRIKAQLESADRVLVALVDNQVVGHARCGAVEAVYWPYQFLVHALFINPDHQGRRAGTTLLKACALEAMSSGHEGLMIGAFVGNKPAMEWYSRLGGRVVEEVPLEVGSRSYTSTFFAFEDLPKLSSRLS